MHHEKFKHPKKGEDSEESNKTPTNVNEPSPKKQKIEEVNDDSGTKDAEEPTNTDEEIEPTEAPESIAEETQSVEETPEPIPEFKDWPKDPMMAIKQNFLVKMPEDFLAFWDFCKNLNREDPRIALQKSCGLVLVGPYDILAGQEFKSTNLNDFLCHYRYYRDPPEFQTVIASAEEGNNFHIGYFRDDPNEDPVFIASYGGKTEAERENYKFTILGDNLFAALYAYIGQLITKADPFMITCSRSCPNEESRPVISPWSKNHCDEVSRQENLR